MLCKNCYKEVPDGTKFCPECGTPLDTETPQNPVNLSANHHTMSPGTPQKVLPAKQSSLSVVAMIFAILTCTAIVGLILGIIDLATKQDDNTTHGGSIFAIIWGGIVTLIVAIIVFFAITFTPAVADHQDSILSPESSSENVNTNEEDVVVGDITDGVIKTSDYTIKITNSKVIPAGQEGNKYGDGPVLAIWYDTTNTSGKEISPMMAWIPIAKAVQDNDPNMVNEIHVGMLPDSSFTDSQMADIKEGGTVANAVAYELSDTTTPVVITFTDGLLGKEIGTITFNLN